MVARVVAFVEKPEIGFHLPLDVRGTAFQQRVWRHCGRFRLARPSRMRRSRTVSEPRRRYARSPVRAPKTN